MTYFLTAPQRKETQSTLYFEFQKGRFRHKFWKDDSIYLHADIFDRLGLDAIFSELIPNFHYFADTWVSAEQYHAVRAVALAHGGELAAVFAELDVWVTECFRTEDCFTILGT
jgi:hypothetical protein